MSETNPAMCRVVFSGSGNRKGFMFFVDDVLETSQICTFAESLCIG